MKQITFFFFFMACFFMSNAVEQPVWKILSSKYDLDPSGAYQFNYETENAIQQNEEGSLKRIKNEDGKEEDVVVVRGSYSYQDPNGQTITVVYFADETGFHAEGAHIPVPNAVVPISKYQPVLDKRFSAVVTQDKQLSRLNPSIPVLNTRPLPPPPPRPLARQPSRFA